MTAMVWGLSHSYQMYTLSNIHFKSSYTADPTSYATRLPRASLEQDHEQTIARRKKARRSCFGCQKAHRTCGTRDEYLANCLVLGQLADLRLTGDERPCQTCVKRGMGHACFDGARKIPKYLGDMPGVSIMEISAARTSPTGQDTEEDGSSRRSSTTGKYSVLDLRASATNEDHRPSTNSKRKLKKSMGCTESWDINALQEQSTPPNDDERELAHQHEYLYQNDTDTPSSYADDFFLDDEYVFGEWPTDGQENIGFAINSGWCSTFFPG